MAPATGARRAEWARGWRQVVATGLGAATGLSLFAYLTSVFIPHYAREFGWSRGEIGLAAFATLAAGLFGPVLGRLADRMGSRRAIVACALGYGAACTGMAMQTGDIRLYYGLYFCVVLFGLGTTSLLWARGVAAAFEASRGLALSVALSFVTVTAIVTPPLLAALIGDHGWRAGWLALGALAVLGAAAGLMLAPAEPAREARPAETTSLKAAARIPAFWLAVAGMFLINIPSGGIMNQMAALIGDKGLEPAQVALVMSAFGGSVFAGRLLAGACLDRFPAHWVAFWAMALPAAGCVILSDWAGGTLLLAVVAGIALAGLSQGAEGDIGPFVVARRFGFAAFGGLLGALSAATTAGTAAGAILFSQSFDRTGSYDLALGLGAGAFLAGALCYLALGRGPAEAID